MAKIRFTRKLGTSKYGMVEVGDVVDVSDVDARRYIGNSLAEALVEPTPKRKPAAKGRATGRNGKEG